MKDFLRRSDEGFFFVGQTKGSLVRKKKQKPFPRKKGFRKGGQVSFFFFEKTLSLDSHHFLSEDLGDRKKERFFFLSQTQRVFFVGQMKGFLRLS